MTTDQRGAMSVIFHMPSAFMFNPAVIGMSATSTRGVMGGLVMTVLVACRAIQKIISMKW